MRYYNLFKIYSLLIGTLCLTGCIDDDLPKCMDESSSQIVPEDQYGLGFTVTLDRMGGTRAVELYDQEKIDKMENYIDPEKFRVLFFDSKEQFLFESKSRWVKRESNDASSTVWFVSVPFYTYGNDMDYNWEFDSIRKVLTREDFQIVLLVNRPLNEYASDYKTTGGTSGGGGESGWFYNNNPDWKKSDSRFLDGGFINSNPKKIFDIHHSQYDAVYMNKCSVDGMQNYNNGEGFYNFIMGVSEEYPLYIHPITGMKCNTMMGSYNSWVDWVGEDVDPTDDLYHSNYEQINDGSYKRVRLPSEKHPIPMYGTQKFKAIDPEDWKQGTTFTLGRVEKEYKDKAISLLRSSVKLELITPKSKGKLEWAALYYSNIYSRCEPMDIWTPTDEIWYNGVTPDDKGSHDCEMEAIKAYGPISKSGDITNSADRTAKSLKDFQQRISWFYGSWIEKGWTFGSLGVDEVTSNGDYDYPRVFNPMTQRNETISYGMDVNPVYEDANNYHYIVYTGERNLNDPSNLSILGGNGSAITNSTCVFWIIKFENNTNVYMLPVTDYSNGSNKANAITPVTNRPNDNLKTLVDGERGSNGLDAYAMQVRETSAYSWPLIRNHVYKIYLTSSTRGGDEIHVWSEHSFTKDICFSDKIIRSQDQKKALEDVKIGTLDKSIIKK